MAVSAAGFRCVAPDMRGYGGTQKTGVRTEDIIDVESETDPRGFYKLKPREPLNADSHLAFMAGALRTCVTYRNRPNEPVCFIDLDGVHEGNGAGFGGCELRIDADQDDDRRSDPEPV